MHAVLHRVLITHVVNEDGVPKLADPLDPSLALLQTCRIPRKIEVDQRAEPLKIQPFASCIRPEQKADLMSAEPSP